MWDFSGLSTCMVFPKTDTPKSDHSGVLLFQIDCNCISYLTYHHQPWPTPPDLSIPWGGSVWAGDNYISPSFKNIHIYVYIHCVCHHVTHVLDILHPQYIFITPEWYAACHQPIVIRSFAWSPAAAMGIRIVASWGAAAHSGAMCRSWEATVIETVRLKFFFVREKHLVVPKMWLFFPRWARRIVHKQSVETVLNFHLHCNYDLERFCFFGIAQFITHIFCLW